MSKKRVFSLLLIVCLMLLPLTACTSGTPASTQTTAATPAPAETATSAPAETASAGPTAETEPTVFKLKEPIVINAMVSWDERTKDVNHMWLFDWARDKMNIDIQMTYAIDRNQFDTVAPLKLATGDYPEVILWSNYIIAGVVEQTLYGDEQGILVPLQDYFKNPEIMPNMSKIMVDYAKYLPLITTVKGNIYALPGVGVKPEWVVGTTGLYYDKNVLKTLGLGVPKTTDELLNFLRQVKANDPKKLDKNNIPFGGNWTTGAKAVMQAFGFNANSYSQIYSAKGDYVNGDAAFIATFTDPAYLEVLKFLNTLYKDGLVTPDWFTVSDDAVAAGKAEGYYSLFGGNYIADAGEENWKNYDLLPALTSAQNASPFVVGSDQLWASQQVFLTDKSTEEQRVAMMRLSDMFYDNEFRFQTIWGPQKDVDSAYNTGLKGWVRPQDQPLSAINAKWVEDISSGAIKEWPYRYQIAYITKAGLQLDRRTDAPPWETADATTAIGYQTIKGQELYKGITIMNVPRAHFPGDMEQKMEDQMYAIIPYVETEIAKFVTGERALTQEEFEKLGKELEGMGYSEWILKSKTINDGNYKK